MTCPQSDRMVHMFLDGEFDELEQGRYEQHLQGCEACRGVLLYESNYRQICREVYQPEDLPDSCHERLRSRLHGVGSRRVAWVSTAAAASIAVLGGWIWLGTPESSESSEVITQDVLTNLEKTAAPSEIPAARGADQWIQKRASFDPHLVRFEKQGMNLTGVQIDQVRKRAAAHARFTSQGRPVTVTAIQGDDLPIRTPQVEEHAGRRFFFDQRGNRDFVQFSQDGVTYSVTGEMPRNELLKLVSGP